MLYARSGVHMGDRRARGLFVGVTVLVGCAQAELEEGTSRKDASAVSDTRVADASFDGGSDARTDAFDATLDTAPDTSVVDTGSPDTGSPDTGDPDTGDPDTGAADTGVVVTDAPPCTPTGGTSSGTITSASARSKYRFNSCGCLSPLLAGAAAGTTCSTADTCAEVCCPCATGSKKGYNAQACISGTCATATAACSAVASYVGC